MVGERIWEIRETEITQKLFLVINLDGTHKLKKPYTLRLF